MSQNPCAQIEVPHYTVVRSYVDKVHGKVWKVKCSCGWKSARYPNQDDAIAWEFFHHKLEEKHAQTEEADPGAGAEDLR